MLLGACILMAALMITLVVNRRETARAEPIAAAADVEPLAVPDFRLLGEPIGVVGAAG